MEKLNEMHYDSYENSIVYTGTDHKISEDEENLLIEIIKTISPIVEIEPSETTIGIRSKNEIVVKKRFVNILALRMDDVLNKKYDTTPDLLKPEERFHTHACWFPGLDRYNDHYYSLHIPDIQYIKKP